ncbi:MAG TPA: choice-of-anchor Q domain-containing protein, partial [Pyrinomonadaceae bacterium]|nr:choice-of-anchor Q domain-containing protein [Pyrinomonadaceae bacterium]
LNITGGASDSGGAIQNSGTLALVGVSLYGNTSTGGGGAIRNDGTLALVNSTLSGNSAASAISDGGALLNAAGKTATLLNVTVTDNTAGRDGNGIHNSGTLVLKNSLVAGNGSTGAQLFDAGTTDATGSITSGTPGLSALAFRGGPTRTHVPLPDSTTINAGTEATTLDGPVDDSQTTVNLTDAAAIPVGLLLRVGDEQMLVTAKNGNALTVARASNGTNAAAHDGGAAVNPAFDQRGAGFARKTGGVVDIGAAEANYALTATAGTPQSVTLGALFPALFKATVTESGTPVGGLSVNFDAPASGASGTFTGTGTNSASVATDPDGVATAPAFSANAVAGVYNVAASLAGGSPSVNFGLTNLKLGQTITFDALPGKTFGDAAFNVGATGGASGNAVTFSSTTPAFCSVSGNTITILAATVLPGDTCTVRASQAGNDNYDAAADVDRSFRIAKAATNTTVNVGNVIFDGQPHGATAVATGAGGLSQNLNVTYTGRNGTNYPASPTAPTNAGDYAASATFAGDANHDGSGNSKDFSIAKALSTTTVTCAGGNVYTGSPLTPCSASVSGAGGLSQTLSVTYSNNVNAGTATASATFAGDANHDGSNGSQTFSIGKAAQTISFGALTDKTFG